MRVVIATDSFAPKVDGVADTSDHIARMLTQRGHRVLVIAPGPGRSTHGGYPVIRVRSVPFPLYPELRMAVPSGALTALIRRQSLDAAIVLTPGVIGLSVARAVPSRTRLINIYTTDMTHYAGVYGLSFLRAPVEAGLRWLSDRASVTLCPTELVRADLAARGHKRLVVWGRGIDARLFRPEKRNEEMRWRLTGGEPEKPLVLYVGRLAREKRLLDLLDAAHQISGVRFALVGDGPLRDLLERRFSSVPSVFTGVLRGERLAQAFASADVFAFPSVSETFGQVVLQAMASGLPPVVVEGTAPAEFVVDGVVGLHIPPRKPSALASAIASLTTRTDLRQAMAAAARQRALGFTWDALIDRLEAMINRAPTRTIIAG